MSGEDNLKRMKTLDDAWNGQDWEVFRKRHSADTAVYWPGQPEPTRGRDAHQVESAAFFKAFENQLENDPYKVMIASGDWTATIANWSGKMVGPFPGTSTRPRLRRGPFRRTAVRPSASSRGCGPTRRCGSRRRGGRRSMGSAGTRSPERLREKT